MSFTASYIVELIDNFSAQAKTITSKANAMNKALGRIKETAQNLKIDFDVINSSLQETVNIGKDFNKVLRSDLNLHESAKLLSQEMRNVKNNASNMESVMKKLQETVKASAENATHMRESLDLAQQSHDIGVLAKSIDKIAKNMEKSKKETIEAKKGLKDYAKEFNEFADKFATSAYYRFLNVGLPVMAFTAPALKDLGITQDLDEVIKSSANNFKFLDEQARSFADSTKFSLNDLKQAQAELLRMGASGKDVKKAMQGIVEFAAESGQTVAKATMEVAEAALKGAQVGSTKVMARGGSSLFRLMQDTQMLNAKFSQIAERQAQTVSGSIIKSLSNMGTAFADVFSQIGPPIAKTIQLIASLTEKIAKFLEKHKTLAKAIGVTIVVMGSMMAGMIAIGVVIGAVSMAFSSIATVVGVATTAVASFGTAVAIITSPITLIVAGITAMTVAVGVVIYKFGSLKQMMKDIYIFIKDYLLAKIHAVTNAFHKIGDFTKRVMHLGGLSPKEINNQKGNQEMVAMMVGQQQRSRHEVFINVSGQNVNNAYVRSNGDTGAIHIGSIGSNYGSHL